MKRKQLQLDLPGLLVAPVTPFGSDGRVEWAQLHKQIEFMLTECRPAAVLVSAVEVQEYQYLTFEERCELVKRTIAFVDGKAPVIVGVSHPNTRISARLTGLAEELGATGVQLLIPHRPSGGSATLSEIIAYFEAVARETSLPVVAYHNPGPGADLGPKELSELCELEAVQAFKESTRNFRHIGQMIELVERPGHARYMTTMEVFLASLDLGASGCTLPVPGAVLARRLLDAFLAGRHTEAAALQQIFSFYPSRWMGTGGLAAVMKETLNLMGIEVGAPYPPFAPLTPAQKGELKDFLKSRTDLLA
jgi:4-hydroxy-tetrahydrodipicolinate synthase